MSILIGEEIEKALANGSIKIEPLDRSQVGPGSIDLTLGNDFRMFKKKFKVYHISNDSRLEDITSTVHVPDGSYIVVKPGEMILGITKERITLAENISGRLEGRSRFARFGLAVHVTAGFMHPGISNHQVLEIVNLDFNGNPHSSIVDASLTKVMEKRMVKVIACYDNEWGYSSRVRDLILYIVKKQG